jgi:hypothetical protein
MPGFKTKRIVGAVALFFVSFVLLNNIFFVHLHVLSNGQIIEHAHPYRSSQDSRGSSIPHKHSQRDLLALSFVNDLFRLASPVMAALFSLVFRSYFILIANYIFSVLKRFIFNRLSRSPPVAELTN